MSTLKVDTLQHRDGTEYILSERNKLINGDFSVAQRGTSITSATDTTNNDANYTLDRWQLFSDGNDVVDVTQETTTVPTNQLYAIALDVETANKSFKAKVSATTNLDNVKCAIIAWDGTADSLTDDMISAWGSEGTDPTLATNYTYENTPANLNLTTSYATYTTTATIDTSGDVQLEKGPSNSIFERKSYGQQLLDCQRYLYRYDSSENTFARIANGTVRSTTCHIPFSMKVTMRSAPTLESISAASTFRVAGASNIATCTSIALNEAGKDVVGFNFVTASSSLGDSGWSSPNNTTSAFFNLSSEM
jgi:hypothetical protein